MTTGQRIKAARKKAGMTQAELAAKLHIPYQSISQWERGVRNPKIETIGKIADALNVSTFEIIGSDSFPEALENGLVTPSDIAIEMNMPEKKVWEIIQNKGEYDPEIVEKVSIVGVALAAEFSQKNSFVNFSSIPDSEWSDFENKLRDETITPEELQRYKELLAQSTDNAHKAISAAMERLEEYMNLLNDKGQSVAVERVEELTKIPDYRRTTAPPEAAQEPPDGKK